MDEIKYELKRHLQKTVWAKVGGIDKRTDQLIDIHSTFINKMRDEMSADEIANRLFKYEENILKSK